MTVVDTYIPGLKKKRYVVEFYSFGSWNESAITFRTRLFAQEHARGFASLGYRARVIDTKDDA